jgi:hypothetical protein
MLQCFSVFLLPFILDGLQDHVIPDLPATTRSLYDVLGMSGSDMHAVAWKMSWPHHERSTAQSLIILLHATTKQNHA